MHEKDFDKAAPELPPKRLPVINHALPSKTNKAVDYEYMSITDDQATAMDYSKPQNSVLPPRTNKYSDYELMSFSNSQVISFDYSKNVVHWHKKSKEKNELLSQCNPYEETINGESVYEDPGTSKEMIYAYFEQKKFRKIYAKNLR